MTNSNHDPVTRAAERIYKGHFALRKKPTDGPTRADVAAIIRDELAYDELVAVAESVADSLGGSVARKAAAALSKAKGGES